MYDLALLIRDNVDHEVVLDKFSLKAKDYVLTTIHRAENTDTRENLKNILQALLKAAAAGMMILFPVHPRTKKAMNALGILPNEAFSRIQFVDPVPYSEMVSLEANARLIVTDSGGVQKEGYFYGTPCVIARAETEWIELVDSGWARLAGPDKKEIYHQICSLWMNRERLDRKQFYGDGLAAGRICAILRSSQSTASLRDRTTRVFTHISEIE